MIGTDTVIQARRAFPPRRRCALAVTAMLSLASAAGAQTGTGEISGRVTDPSGRGLRSVVTGRNATSGKSRSVTADANGAFRFESIPEGRYTVSAGLKGYDGAPVENVQVASASIATADLVLATAARSSTPSKGSLTVYGFAMTDMGYQFNQSDPDWYDVLRTTKLPTMENQFGEDGSTYASVRQSRLGVKGNVPTDMGELKTTFEFELFGVGADAGQTTFRLRHAYGELGAVGAGQTWSPFMDIDVFPNSIEYWGPTGMVFYRNVQARFMPIKGDSFLTIALERPGASPDPGDFAGRVELESVSANYPLPDLSAEYRHAFDFGYIEAAGMLRRIEWNDFDTTDGNDLSGEATGWGLNLSSNVKIGKRSTARLQYVFGEGIQNYMNDAPADIGIRENFSDPVHPVEGEALGVRGLVAFVDVNWNDQWSSTFGYSRTDIDNSNGQSFDAYKTGQYALANLLYYPIKNVMMGGELQWGRRDNLGGCGADCPPGFLENADDFRVQFSFKYNFSHTMGGN